MDSDSAKKSAISIDQARQVLQTPEARQLIALLSRDGGAQLQQAAALFRQGDQAAAQETLRPLLENREATALLKKLGEK